MNSFISMIARCGKCSNPSFEVHENSDSSNGANYYPLRFNTVSCSNCGMPIGILQDQSELVSQIQDALSSLRALIEKIDQNRINQEYSFTHKMDELETELTQLRYKLS